MRKSFCGSFRLHGELRQPRRHRVDLARVDVPDHLTGHLARAHPPLGVEREADVGLLEPALEAPRLGEEVRAPGLDVEHQQRLRLACRAVVAVDDRGVLARVVALALARVGGGGDRDQLHGGEHRAPRGRVRLGLALEPPRRVRRRADPERAELVVLRRAVVGDDPPVRQQLRARRAAARRAWAPPRFFALAACFAGVRRRHRRRAAPRRPPRSAAATPSATRRRRRKTAGLGGAVATAPGRTRYRSNRKPRSSSLRACVPGSGECSSTTPSRTRPRRTVATRQRPAASVKPVLTPVTPR